MTFAWTDEGLRTFMRYQWSKTHGGEVSCEDRIRFGWVDEGFVLAVERAVNDE